MSYLEDKSALIVLPVQTNSLGHSGEGTETLDRLPEEQIVALREFFELLAKWDGEESNHGN
jgi:hypothetical protein